MRKLLLLTCCFLSGCANLDEHARSDHGQCAYPGVDPEGPYNLHCRAQLATAAHVPLKKSGAEPERIAMRNGRGRIDRWVTENSGLKIQTKTDALTRTAESTQDSRTLVVTITKNAAAEPGALPP